MQNLYKQKTLDGKKLSKLSQSQQVAKWRDIYFIYQVITEVFQIVPFLNETSYYNFHKKEIIKNLLHKKIKD